MSNPSSFIFLNVDILPFNSALSEQITVNKKANMQKIKRLNSNMLKAHMHT